MPFRSEAEQIREQIRRSEEQAADLLREKAGLEHQLRRQSPRSAWVLGLVVALICGLVVGGIAGSLNHLKRRSAFREEYARESADFAARRRAVLADCQTANADAQKQLERCERDLSRRRAGAAPR